MAETDHHKLKLIVASGGSPQVDMQALLRLTEKPPLYAPGEAAFWDDPHISAQMLAAHLSPEIDAASRTPKTIDATVDWLAERFKLAPGGTLLDLGCGPGLYAQRLAARGLRVTGIDFSRRSVEYARNQAAAASLDISYVYQDYLTMDWVDQFDTAIMIYYDFGVLGDEQRNELLHRIVRALRPGGRFVFDVPTQQGRAAGRATPGWYASTGGFWRPGAHWVLTRVHLYPEHDAEVDEYVVVDPSGTATVYRVWQRFYTPDTIAKALAPHGLEVESLHSELSAQPYTGSGPGIGVVARLVAG